MYSEPTVFQTLLSWVGHTTSLQPWFEQTRCTLCPVMSHKDTAPPTLTQASCMFLLHTQYSALTKTELFHLQKTKMLIVSYLHSPVCMYKLHISLYCIVLGCLILKLDAWVTPIYTLTQSLNVFCLELEDVSWNFLKWPKNQHWWLKYKILINSKIALHHSSRYSEKVEFFKDR